MNKSFFRKVGFGLAVDDILPNNPVNWAIDQMMDVPELNWKGPIYSLKEMMNFHGIYNYTDRRILRKKYKNSRQEYKNAKRNLKYTTGHYYFEPLWLYIRHNEAVNGSAPVFQRFLHFWGNHFAIQQKNAMYVYDVGPYHREVIAPAMIKNIEEYYNIADIVIVPSAFGEGFSNVLVEGMLTNLLPVATEVGDARKIIGKTGFIIRGHNKEILKNELSKIIKIKPTVIKQMSIKARDRANKLFTVKKMIKSYNNTFSKVKF